MENIIKLTDDTLEQVVLGCILLDGNLIYTTSLKPSDFYRTSHQKIFEVMLKMKENNIPIDTITIIDEIKKNNIDIPLSYLMQLTNNVPTTLNFSVYESNLKEKSLKRQIYLKMLKTLTMLENNENLSEIIQNINDIINIDNIDEALDFKSILTQIWDKITQNNKLDTISFPDELNAINKKIGGFVKGTLNIIASRPSIGKTAMALQLLLHFIEKNYKTIMFSLEMSTESLVRRIISQLANIPLSKINHFDLNEKELAEISKVFAYLYEKPFEIIDTSGLAIEDVERICNLYYSKYGLDIIIIDYLSLMNLPHKERKVDAIGEISKRLKLLAKKLNIVVILLAQLNRNPEERTDKRIALSDLRDSGNLEQDADMVFGIHRKPNELGLPTNIGEIILLKNRDGEVAFFPIIFNENILTFRTIE